MVNEYYLILGLKSQSIFSKLINGRLVKEPDILTKRIYMACKRNKYASKTMSKPLLICENNEHMKVYSKYLKTYVDEYRKNHNNNDPTLFMVKKEFKRIKKFI